MTLSEYLDRKIPEYYPTMYLDGYTQTQILMAQRKSMRKRFMPKEDDYEIYLTSEMKVKK